MPSPSCLYSYCYPPAPYTLTPIPSSLYSHCHPPAPYTLTATTQLPILSLPSLAPYTLTPIPSTLYSHCHPPAPYTLTAISQLPILTLPSPSSLYSHCHPPAPHTHKVIPQLPILTLLSPSSPYSHHHPSLFCYIVWLHLLNVSLKLSNIAYSHISCTTTYRRTLRGASALYSFVSLNPVNQLHLQSCLPSNRFRTALFIYYVTHTQGVVS